MNTEKVFKTKTGFCHILEDKIVLTRDGLIGNIAKVSMGNNIVRPLTIYTGISIGLLFAAYTSFKDGQSVSAILFLCIGILLLFKVFKSLNNSASPIIQRDQIKSIEFKKAISGATRAYFIIKFENENGKIKQRLILLPGTLNNGKVEADNALQIMTTEFGHIKNAS